MFDMAFEPKDKIAHNNATIQPFSPDVPMSIKIATPIGFLQQQRYTVFSDFAFER